jgi:hypothetical protein
MKLFVENLGRIRKAEIEIRPLTIFVGANNTNKTWTAYSLFGILQALRWNNQQVPSFFETDPGFEAAIERVVGGVRARILGLPAGAQLFDVIRRADVFASLDAPTYFGLPATEIRAVTMGEPGVAARADLELSVEEMEEGPFSEMRLTADPKTNVLTVEYAGRSGVIASVHKLEELRRIVREFALVRHASVQCLPAERKLLSLLVGTILKERAPLPRPFADFAYAMALAHVRPEGAWSDLVAKLESVVGGRYEMKESTLGFVPASGNGALALMGTASLVKSFAGLAVFLQQAQRGDVLLIDEPEMNAHPRAQAETAELLALLAVRGVTVIVTTHSPYFVEHVSNLIEGASIEDPETRAALAGKLFLRDAEALIPATSVATYGFEESADKSEVIVRELDDRGARTIDWGTFSRVSDEVSNLYGEILDLERESKK